MFSNSNNEYGNLQTQNISTINIQILSESGDFVNFNNTNWTIVLVLLIDRNIKTNFISRLDNTLSISTIPQITEQSSEIVAEDFPNEAIPIGDEEQVEQPVENLDEEQPIESSLDQLNEDEELKLLLQ